MKATFFNRLFFIGALLVFFSGSALAVQSFSSGKASDPDKLIVMEGKVLDIETKQPIKAKFIFQRMPYGGNVGTSKVKTEEGDYQLTLMQSYQYKVKVQAEGYMSLNEVVSTEVIDLEGIMFKDFYMIPTGVGQIVKLRTLIFEQSKTNIMPDSYGELNELAKMMAKNKKIVIQLEGHTDYSGRASLNMALSYDRVKSVKQYLLAKGVKSRRIRLKAFGGSQPISREKTIEKRKINRRVEVRILSI